MISHSINGCVGLIFPLGEEFKYFEQLLPSRSLELRPETVKTSGETYYHLQREGGGDWLPHSPCIVGFVGQGGQDAARRYVKRFLREVRPRHVIVVGIAMLLDDDYGLCDVVVANAFLQIGDYDKVVGPGMVSFPATRRSFELSQRPVTMAKHIQSDPRWPNVAAAVHEDFFSLTDEQRSGLQADRASIELKVAVGEIISGPSVSASTSFRELLRHQGRKYVGYETEAVGVMAALQDEDSPPCEVTVVRGLSDLGDDDKNKLEAQTRNAFRRLSLRNSVRIAFTLLEAGAFSRSAAASIIRSGPETKNLPTELGLSAALRADAKDISLGRGGLTAGDINLIADSKEHDPEQADAARSFIAATFGDHREATHATRDIEIPRRELIRLFRTVAFDQLGLRPNRGEFETFQVDVIEEFFGILEPLYHVMFTQTSFEDATWQQLIKDPMDPRHWENHLHYSNVCIADRILADMHRRKAAGEFEVGHHTVRLMETGPGACNTTYAVFDRLLAEHWGDVDFEYLGFEINALFADSGNRLFHGVSAWARDGQVDPRVLLHARRIKPWPDHLRFIERSNAPEGIGRLLRTQTAATVDYFFSSYMLHHVPNGDALLRFLFGPRRKVHEVLGDPRQVIDFFCRQLSLYLQDRLTRKVSPLTIFSDHGNKDQRMADYAAMSLATYIRDGGSVTSDSHQRYVLSAVRQTMAAAAQRATKSNGIFSEDWVREYFLDPQRSMLHTVYQLLRPGGLVAIADPDGKSRFNQQQMGKGGMKAVEMAVAHFRNLARMREILEALWFEEVRGDTVIKVGDGAFETTPGARLLSDRDISDNNISYLISARKPKRGTKILRP